MRIRISRQDTSSGGASISIFVEERDGKEGAEYHEVGKDDYYWLCRSISKTIFKMLASEPPANNASTRTAGILPPKKRSSKPGASPAPEGDR